ncbi:hypothetical protein BC834DRAFT_972562 [Gloeopeniophorella convolvens]|nr:hypothetical protein BC834DRAFT_972562 [Gloeopeniophorella convolvens]
MNNPKSMVLGWVSLIGVAGVSFYYAKQSINERRRLQDISGERPSAKLDWKERIAQQEPITQQALGGEDRGAVNSSAHPARGSPTSSSKDDAS